MVGYGALGGGDDTVANNIANHNTAIGYLACGGATIGSDGTAVTSTNCVAIGHEALDSITSGYSCVAVGKDAGDAISSGAFNIVIGTGADVSTGAAENQTAIGHGAIGIGNNYAVIGNSATTRVYAADDVGATLYAGSAVVETSDARIKEDIKDSSLGLGFINQLRAVEYKKRQPVDYDESLKKEMNWYKNDRKPRVLDELDKNKCRTGFIAQEVGEILSNMSYDNNNDIVEIDESNTQQMIAYSKLVPPLVKAIQELSAQVEELKNK